MPLFLANFLGGVATWLTLSIPGLVARVLLALGLGVVTITGVDLAASELNNYLSTVTSGLTADVLALLNLAGFDVAINMMIAAWGTYASLLAITGALTRFGPTGSRS